MTSETTNKFSPEPEVDRSIGEIRLLWRDQGFVCSFGSLQRFFRRHAISRKKRRPLPRRSIARIS